MIVGFVCSSSSLYNTRGCCPVDVDGVGTTRDDDRVGGVTGKVDIGGKLREIVSGD